MASDIKYLVIENLMGGVAWIHYEFDDKQSATSKYEEINKKSSNVNFQVLEITKEDLNHDLDNGTLQYLN